ncbi:hypothetical protein ACFZCP_44250 [Streptomyces sp. NPDC007971]
MFQARSWATGRIRDQHLVVLLDAAGEDLGSPGSTPACRRRPYEVLQEIR